MKKQLLPLAMVAAMGAVGVDGAIMVSPNSLYAFDDSYAKEVQRAHPGRFAIVKPMDPDNPAADDIIADWKTVPGAVAVRVMFALQAAAAVLGPKVNDFEPHVATVQERGLAAIAVPVRGQARPDDEVVLPASALRQQAEALPPTPPGS